MQPHQVGRRVIRIHVEAQARSRCRAQVSIPDDAYFLYYHHPPPDLDPQPSMSKEYGKFTADQFKGLINALPEVRRMGKDLHELIAEVPAPDFDALLGSGFNWAGAYELTFHEHLALVTYGLNLVDRVKSIVGRPCWDRTNDQRIMSPLL
jgi:hypothetical protein